MIRSPPRSPLFPNTPLSRSDSNGLTIGTVINGPSAMTASGISTSNDDVKLTVLAGGLVIGAVADADPEGIRLDSSHEPLSDAGFCSQNSGTAILASGLQILG